MELVEIRWTILKAIAADDYLVEHLVLKGGNALELVHHIGSRASVDLDFSIATDFENPDEVKGRLERSLRDRFDAEGQVVFDFSFGPRPTDRERGTPWGGYTALFKVISGDLASSLEHSIEDMRRQATAVGPSQQRKFRFEISAFEHVSGRVETEVDHFTCYVYSLEMIVAEKLRAICQQAPNYEKRAHPTPRARDFYDIHAAIVEGGVSFESSSVQTLVVEMFASKEVPLELIGRLDEQRDFHRTEWPAVVNAVSVTLRDFDYYFDYILEEVRVLEPIWVEDLPS